MKKERKKEAKKERKKEAKKERKKERANQRKSLSSEDDDVMETSNASSRFLASLARK